MLACSRSSQVRTSAARGLACVLLVFGSGCVHLHRTIELNVDGSGRLVEELEFEESAFELAKEDAALLEKFLKEESVRERLLGWGEVKLESYTLLQRGGRVRGGRTVVTFEDLEKVIVPALPHRGANWPVQTIRFKFHDPTTADGGYMTRHRYHRLPLSIRFEPSSTDVATQSNNKPPAEQEKLRALLPVLRSMLGTFQVSLKLKAFMPEDVALTYTLFEVGAADLQDDDTLTKVVEWNRFPDPLLGVTKLDEPMGGLGNGRLLLKSTLLNLPYPSPISTSDAVRMKQRPLYSVSEPKPAPASREAPKAQKTEGTE